MTHAPRRLSAGLLLVLALLALLAAPALLRAEERPVAEELMLGLSRTIQETARAAIPKTVAIKIHVGAQQGFGSGAVISPDGYILTCAHVIEPARRHTVVTSDGRELAVKVLGINAKNDYCLIKVEPGERKLAAFKIGSSAALKIRDWVIALGHPGGPYADLQPAVAVGRVRGLGRKLPVGLMQKFYDQAIMTDCPIFGGNSGGPLINLDGELVGINGAILLVNKNAYAVPSDEMAADLERLKRGEAIEGRGPKNIFETFKYMQDIQKELDPEDMEKLYGKSPMLNMFRQFMGQQAPKKEKKVTVSVGARLEPGADGLVFRDVDPQGTSGLAGVREGDVLVAIDSVRVRDQRSLEQALLPCQEGQGTIVEVRRGGESLRRVAVFHVQSADRDPMLSFALNRIGRKAALSTVKIRGGAEEGYGVIVSERHILTCDHILGESTRAVRVELVDGTAVSARIVGRDGELDIALLEADLAGKRCQPARLGDSQKLVPGQWVISGGSPRGPVLAGAVSATNRKVMEQRKVPALGLFGMFGQPNESPMRRYAMVFQHDAPLVKGDFGTGVYNADGELVGLNVALWYRGSTFAIPASALQSRLAALQGGLVVAQPPSWSPPQGAGGLGDLFRQFFGGEEERPEQPSFVKGQGFIGVQIDPEKGEGKGVYVKEVVDGQPAQAAGMKAGDIIVKVGDKATPSPEELVATVSAMKPGVKAAISVLRGSETVKLEVTVGRRPRQ